ncbi:MAG: S8 family serine peptidase [Nanoarchaeota archaeon]
MKGVIISYIFLVLPSVLAVSEERYIIELKDNKIDKHIEDSIIAELYIGRLNQVGGARVGLGKNRIVVINISREILESEDSVINLEPDYRVYSLGNENWNYNAIGLNFSVIDSNFGEEVKMAVLDTGVNYNILSINSGYDFVNEDSDAFDDNSHGTLVSQILRNPGTNFPLIESQVYSIKVLDSNGEGYVSDIIEGINWAGDKILA